MLLLSDADTLRPTRVSRWNVLYVAGPNLCIITCLSDSWLDGWTQVTGRRCTLPCWVEGNYHLATAGSWWLKWAVAKQSTCG